ncbi:MAG: hypothetical protein ACFCU5_07625 [Pleurocapsa sp.]
MVSLQIVNQLINKLEQENIYYCHWKSNEHINAAVEGKTDLDILVDKTNKEQLEKILPEIGFKYFEAIPCRRYKNIEDYLAIDEETGTLVHFHLHYQLELGEKQLKGYHLPWEELILSSRIYDRQHQIYIAEPNIEIILLIVRAALKVRNRDRVKSLLGYNYFKGDFIREFDWLKDRIDLAQVKQLSEKLLGKNAAQLILDAIAGNANLTKLLLPNNAISSVLQQYRYYNPIVAMALRWNRESKDLIHKILTRIFHLAIVTRRTPVKGGVIVAILGADGSGKSTVISEITKSFAQKLDVLPIYLGSGDGKASIIRQPLIWMAKASRAAKASQSKCDNNLQSTSKQSILSRLHKFLWAISLTYEKQNKLKQACAAKERGMIVICDRYPQSQILGFNDGPLLVNGQESTLKLLQKIEQWEFESYQNMAATMPPDLVIKLKITPEVAKARKSETPSEMVHKKIAAVQALKFSPQTTVITVDAEQPLKRVLATAKRAVWESL